MRNLVLLFVAAAVVLLTAAMLFTAGWSHPPIHGLQTGYRGTGADQLSTDKSESLLKLANTLPDPIDKASPDGDRATSAYKNVQVLTDLSVDQFNRVMLGLSAWVAPQDQGCTYCHNPDNMADDNLYTKKVARVMLKMTCHINKDWQAHVGAVGVTCYTCHRGQPVPANVWFKGARETAGFATNNDGLGHPDKINGSTGLSTDPFSGYLDGDGSARVQATQALPVGYGAPIQQTEKTYSLMMSVSNSLGVNCTYCHSSRAFSQWPQSTPQRVTAWHGIQMTRELNAQYLETLQSEWPPNRLGPTGDGPKLYCATCHQGAPKPLLGVSLAKDWPELGGVSAP
jgi:photosynthetic reaction center cytochrome c subunit